MYDKGNPATACTAQDFTKSPLHFTNEVCVYLLSLNDITLGKLLFDHGLRKNDILNIFFSLSDKGLIHLIQPRRSWFVHIGLEAGCHQDRVATFTKQKQKLSFHRHAEYIPSIMHIWFAVLYFVLVIIQFSWFFVWFIYPHPSGFIQRCCHWITSELSMKGVSKIDLYQTTAKHNKGRTVSISPGTHCICWFIA